MDPVLPQRIWRLWRDQEVPCTLRRTLHVTDEVRVQVHLCSSGAARLLVDGEELALSRRRLPYWRAMRRAELELPAGEHEVTIHAEPGPDDQPFVLVSFDGEDGTRLLASDAEWSVHAGDGVEEGAWVTGGVWAEPWGLPCDAPLDYARLSTGWQDVRCADALATARHVETRPGLVSKGAGVWVEEGRVVFTAPEPHAAPAPELGERRADATWYRTREFHSRLTNRWLELHDARAPALVLEYAAETFARVRLRLRSSGEATVAVVTAESRGELERYAARVADVVTLCEGETFVTCPTGFRFLALVGLGHTAETLELDELELQHVVYPVEEVGLFECDADDMNELWGISRRTLHLCMQNEVWDGIRRDQLPWMGDLYVEALACWHAFADTRLVRRTLLLLGDMGPGPPPSLADQHYPGLSRAWASEDPDINGIPSYTIWWLIGVADFVRYSGERSLLDELGPRIEHSVRHICAQVDEAGFWRHRCGWDFVDWSPLGEEERHLFCHLLAIEALRATSELELSTDLRSFLERMQAAVRARIEREGPGFLATCHQLAARAILAGVVEGDEAQELFDRALGDDPPQRMTFWHRFGDLEAARKLGRVEWGLSYVRRHWGEALRAGHSTLWEAFEPEWAEHEDPHAVSVVGPDHARYGGYETSLCHGWSAGPLVWLHRAILGVEHLASDRVRLAPALGDLRRAVGRVPTRDGAVELRLWREDGRLQLHVRHPKSVQVELDPGWDGAVKLETS